MPPQGTKYNKPTIAQRTKSKTTKATTSQKRKDTITQNKLKQLKT